MIYTFNEAIAELKQDRVFNDSVAEGFALDIINQLQEEYAPTVEMTKTEQVKLLDYLEMSNLQEFMDVVTYEDDLYETLSFEDIAQAWLHPETIKVVDE